MVCAINAAAIPAICSLLTEAREKPSTKFLVNIGMTRLTNVDIMLNAMAIANRPYEGLVSLSSVKNGFSAIFRLDSDFFMTMTPLFLIALREKHSNIFLALHPSYLQIVN
ncbi:hypothetical protein D3C78_978310 [compost metagenome]